MARVLVIGGTLFIGRALVDRLLERGDDVVIMHRGRLVRHGALAELTGGRGGLEQIFLSLTAGPPRPGGGPS